MACRLIPVGFVGLGGIICKRECARTCQGGEEIVVVVLMNDDFVQRMACDGEMISSHYGRRQQRI